MSVRTLLLVALCGNFSAGCSSASDQRSGLHLTLQKASPLTVDQLKLTISRSDGEMLARLVDTATKANAEQLRLLVWLADSWTDTELTVTVEGWQDGSLVARAENKATAPQHALTAVTLTLRLACNDDCSADGDRQCFTDGLRRCVRNAQGCLVWTSATPCPDATPFCSLGHCAASCENECQAGTQRCNDERSFSRCAQYDSDDCLDLSPPISCGADERCRPSDGQCVLDCSDGKCACQAGDTQPCADVGRCSGGQRQCEAGTFGACRWTVGPAVESCNGADDDCDTQIDEPSDLVAPNCDKQAGVCQGAVKRCGGAAGWLTCDAAVYAATAKAAGLTYEAEETLCDGKDNDCDGQTDEHASCCKPSCVGKACGQDDGCGNPCQTGSCPTNASCQAGKCTCDFVACGASCCAASDICVASQCESCAGTAGWELIGGGPLRLGGTNVWTSHPSLALDGSNPVVALTEAPTATAESVVKVARMQNGKWTQWAAFDVVPKQGASLATLAASGKGLLLAWIEDDKIYVRRHENGSWKDLGVASGNLHPSVASRFDLRADANDNPLLAFSGRPGTGGELNIYVVRHTNGTWQQLGGALSATTTATSSAFSPLLTLDGSGNPVVAWREASPFAADVNKVMIRVYKQNMWQSHAADGASAGGLHMNGYAWLPDPSFSSLLLFTSEMASAGQRQQLHLLAWQGASYKPLVGPFANNSNGWHTFVGMVLQKKDGTRLLSWVEQESKDDYRYTAHIYSQSGTAAPQRLAQGNPLPATAGSSSTPRLMLDSCERLWAAWHQDGATYVWRYTWP